MSTVAFQVVEESVAPPHARAAELLRKYAQELFIAHTRQGVTGVDWCGDDEAEAEYSEMLACAEALSPQATLVPTHGNCCNEACGWRGYILECCHLGSVGPLCPMCREVVEPEAA